MITGQDIEQYTCGCCYDLALALHEVSGWELEIMDCYGRGDGNQTDRYGVPIRPDHAYVVAPCGMGLDIRGAAPLWDIWGARARANVAPEQVANLRWRAHDPERTAALAEFLYLEHKESCGCDDA